MRKIHMVMLLMALPAPAAAQSLCGGTSFAVTTPTGGHTPYIDLNLDGKEGPFLYDLGDTDSDVSDAVWPGSGQIQLSGFSLPSFSSGAFNRRTLAADLPAGRTIHGVVGTDFAKLLTTELDYSAAGGGSLHLSVPTCPVDLAARGYRRISQKGFFHARPEPVATGVANVPVVFVRVKKVRTWAQVDTGYNDSVWAHSVDINQAMLAALRKRKVKLTKVGSVDIATCAGNETWPVYRSPEKLIVEDEAGHEVRRFDTYHLIVKEQNSCGGIATTNVPAGQLGASFLRDFGITIFDPKAEALWIRGTR